MAVMNQFNKENPRFITASFKNPPYTFPKFDADEDDEDDLFCDGWALKGTMCFVIGRIADDEPEEENSEEHIFRYGTNNVTFAENKGLRSFNEEDYTEDENGNKMLKPSKYSKYFNEEDEWDD